MDTLRELAARYGGLAWKRRWWGVLAAWIICVGGWMGHPDICRTNTKPMRACISTPMPC